MAKFQEPTACPERGIWLAAKKCCLSVCYGQVWLSTADTGGRSWPLVSGAFQELRRTEMQAGHSHVARFPAACLPGSFGQGCAGRCACPLGAPCHHATGRCACPPGATGSACEKGVKKGAMGLQVC